MSTLQVCELPEQALLRPYKLRGAYTDCYAMDLPSAVPHADYVEAFYTTALFKVERQVLAWFAARPSTDLQARQLARGEVDQFAAWHVEGRDANQLLLCDFLGRTRSWLMSVPIDGGPSPGTRLYFGSAVVPKSIDPKSGKPAFGLAFRALTGFHHLYSQALLRAAASRLPT